MVGEKYSMRIQHTQHLSAETIDDEISRPRLKTLVIDSGNVCNLACRTCGPDSSSSWWREAEFRNQKKSQKFVVTHKKTNLGSLLDEDFSSIQKISILGGEPFQNLDHLEILEHLVMTGNAAACVLFYTTNATVRLPRRVKEIFSHFQSVKLSASIDAVGSQFEYIRTNGQWQDVILNINDWKAIPNVDIKAHPVVSALNVLYLDDLYDWFLVHDLKWTIVLCEWPAAYSFKIFTRPQKDALIRKLQASKHQQIHQPLIKYIDEIPHDPDCLRQFLDETEITCEFRDLAIADYLPELVDFLQI